MDRHREDRQRDWDRDHDHDRFADDPDSQRHRRPSRFSDAPPNNNFTPSPGNFRSGFSPGGPGPGPAGGYRSFHSPPGGVAGGFRPLGPEGCRFRQPAADGGFDANFHPPLSGQKRAFPFSAPPAAATAASPENHERRNFVKLFIGSVPKTATEEDIRPLFEEHGAVIEVTLIKDKRTGQQQGCCFVKYATSDEANRAIQFLHNQCTLPGGIGPIQVRYADGERERLGNVEYKLFVGSLNKHATEKEVEEMFVPYGRVEDVYLMRDDRRQSRGCGFVKFSLRDSAMAAINALNGIYTMRGCDQPLIVRFADPKRPRAGESRGGGPTNGSPGFAPIPVQGGARGPSGGWQPTSPQSIGAFQNSGSHGMHGGFQSVASAPGYAIPSSTSVSPQLTTAVAGAGNYTRTQTNETASERQATQQHYSHTGGLIHQGLPPSQQLPGFSGQLPASGLPPNLNSNQANLQGPNNAAPSASAGAQIPSSMSEHQSPSQLAQMLAQQRQSLQASLQSSQHAFSQLQQQLQMRQPPSNQNQQQPQPQPQPQQQQQQQPQPQPQMQLQQKNQQQYQQQQQQHQPAQWAQSNNTQPTRPVAVPPPKCNWTEHISPDGYKYYYNSVTGESRWTRPEEMAMPDQQQLPQPQPQAQIQHSERLQQPSYQGPGPVGNRSVQGQEWMWKNNKAGGES